MFLQSCLASGQDVQAFVLHPLIIMYILPVPRESSWLGQGGTPLMGFQWSQQHPSPGVNRPFSVAVSVCICVHHSVVCSFCSRDHILTLSPSLLHSSSQKRVRFSWPKYHGLTAGCGLEWLLKESDAKEAGWALGSWCSFLYDGDVTR